MKTLGIVALALISALSGLFAGEPHDSKQRISTNDHLKLETVPSAKNQLGLGQISSRASEGTNPQKAEPYLKPCITREQIDKCRTMVEKCRPAERSKIILQWRDRHGGITNRLHQLIADLQHKESLGVISEKERLRLRRLEVVAKRFKDSRKKELKSFVQDIEVKAIKP